MQYVDLIYVFIKLAKKAPKSVGEQIYQTLITTRSFHGQNFVLPSYIELTSTNIPFSLRRSAAETACPARCLDMPSHQHHYVLLSHLYNCVINYLCTVFLYWSFHIIMNKKFEHNAPINVKPHLPPPGHRWGFVQLIVQRTHPRGNYFLQCPSLDALNTLGQCGDL